MNVSGNTRSFQFVFITNFLMTLKNSSLLCLKSLNRIPCPGIWLPLSDWIKIRQISFLIWSNWGWQQQLHTPNTYEEVGCLTELWRHWKPCQTKGLIFLTHQLLLLLLLQWRHWMRPALSLIYQLDSIPTCVICAASLPTTLTDPFLHSDTIIAGIWCGTCTRGHPTLSARVNHYVN